VTTVVGNVPAEVAARNSAAVLSYAGATWVPVRIGAERTTSGSGPREGPTNHGPDGLGGVRVPPGPNQPEHGVRALLPSVADGAALTLVGLAPLTNVAELAPMADHLVVVGGEISVEEPPELNAGHDLHATERVLATDRPITLYVVDIFERVSVRPADVARLRSSGRPGARLAGELLAVRRNHLIGDAGALVLLTRPELFRVEPRRFGVVGRHLTEAADGRLLDAVTDVDAAAVSHAFADVLLHGPVLP
jgi:inosine-uridine nucleoside N-ribohydrolase